MVRPPASQGPDGKDLISRGLINGSVVLCCQENIALAGHGLFQRPYAARPADLKCYFGIWKNYDVADWDHRVTPNVRRHLICKFLHTYGETNLFEFKGCEKTKGISLFTQK